MRKTLTLAVVLAGLGGIVFAALTGQEPKLVPLTRVQDGTATHLALLAALDEQAQGQVQGQIKGQAEGRTLSYEPSRREREGDDDDQDEPKR
ncbi:hypothetical protein ACQR16_08390 [Bradyrhizobium oligotrophicum]|uniref:hypothetical protein n=1 Tax=Bradyrhizobium oligotrophicum TaxID=44255 RepID=UPI003EBC9134